jgi:hypothetical protein
MIYYIINAVKNTLLLTACLAALLAVQALAATPEEVIDRFNASFARIKDAHGSFTLDTSLQIMGCGGPVRQTGELWYKAPDLIKFTLERDTYFFKGNRIRKIDGQGKRFYVQLVHAPDFAPGFNPKLIAHNFNLKLVKDSPGDLALEGLPKPGVLKNVRKVVFHFDPLDHLLTRMDLSLNYGLTGRLNIKYEKIDGLAVPTATYGRSALEIFAGSLAGLIYDLKGARIRVNNGLADKLFEPGF